VGLTGFLKLLSLYKAKVRSPTVRVAPRSNFRF
jgi:hypothetical protein